MLTIEICLLASPVCSTPIRQIFSAIVDNPGKFENITLKDGQTKLIIRNMLNYDERCRNTKPDQAMLVFVFDSHTPWHEQQRWLLDTVKLEPRLQLSPTTDDQSKSVLVSQDFGLGYLLCGNSVNKRKTSSNDILKIVADNAAFSHWSDTQDRKAIRDWFYGLLYTFEIRRQLEKSEVQLPKGMDTPSFCAIEVEKLLAINRCNGTSYSTITSLTSSSTDGSQSARVKRRKPPKDEDVNAAALALQDGLRISAPEPSTKPVPALSTSAPSQTEIKFDPSRLKKKKKKEKEKTMETSNDTVDTRSTTTPVSSKNFNC